MTDKIKKLEPLNEDVQPEFPRQSRGGYIEDVVDDWLRTHLKEVNEIIKYQNYGVDVVDGLESDLATAQERIQTLEAAPATVVEGDSSAEVETLRAALSEAKSVIQNLEANVQSLKDNASPLDAFPNMESETVQASLLLQQATRLGAEYIDNAKSDGEQIRRDAEDRLVEVRGEIEGLEAQRFATFRTLEDFFSTELSKLRENAVFISKDDSAGEKDVPVSEVPANVPDEEELEEEIKVAEAEGLPVKKADEAENNAETKGSAK